MAESGPRFSKVECVKLPYRERKSLYQIAYCSIERERNLAMEVNGSQETIVLYAYVDLSSSLDSFKIFLFRLQRGKISRGVTGYTVH